MQMILLTLHPELFLGGFLSFCLFHKIGKLAIQAACGIAVAADSTTDLNASEWAEEG